MCPELLLSSVATHRPNTIVLSSRLGAFIVLIFQQLLNLSLFFANNNLNSIHSNKVSVLSTCPSITIDSIFIHNLFWLLIRSANEIAKFFKPVFEYFLIGLSNEEVVFVGTQPHMLCVCLPVESPFERLPEVRVEQHKHRGNLPISVEDIFARILWNVDDPFEVLNCKVGSIHINATIFGNYGNSYKIRLSLRKIFYLFILNKLRNSPINITSKIFLNIRVIELSDLKLGKLCISSDIINTKFVINARAIEACVPKDPDNFGKFIPFLTIHINFINLQLTLYKGLTPISDYIFW